MLDVPFSRSHRRARSLLIGALLALVVLIAGSAAGASPSLPTARTTNGLPTVGPLFANGLGHSHNCTASVVHSARRDLLLTAAHCVSPSGGSLLFAPGYLAGKAPYGVWTVTKAWIDPTWAAGADPGHDFALLSVADQQIGGQLRDIEQVVGANLLQFAPAAGTELSVVGYAAGIDDRPLSCDNAVRWTQTYPTFDCHGYPDGTSGSPWLVREGDGTKYAVVGVIGGLELGGLQEYTSYSSAFGMGVYITLTRADLNLPADVTFRTGGV